MLVIVDRKSLVSALKSVCRVAEKKNNIPIICTVKLDTMGETLRLTATDLDLYETVSIAADIGDASPLCVPAHMFAKLAAQLPEGPITLESVDRESGRMLSISSGVARFDLATLDAADFPGPVQFDHGSFRIAAATLRRLLENTRYAISSEETRFYLNGTLLDVDVKAGRLGAVATDGHRLSVVEAPLPEGAVCLETFKKKTQLDSVIIPRLTCLELLKAFAKAPGDIVVTCTAEEHAAHPRLAFEAGPVRIVTHLIDGTFPDYRRVIPRGDTGNVMRLNRAALAAGIARVTAISAEDGRAVKLSVNGRLVLSVSNPEGETRDEVAADWTGPHDKEFEIGFNGRYLRETLDHCEGDDVEFRMTDCGSPIRIMGADKSALHVLMPMRV